VERCSGNCTLRTFESIYLYFVTVILWAAFMVINFSREFHELFLISNFRRVVNVVFCFVGDSPAPEFYVPTFRNTLFHLHKSFTHDL